MKNTDALREEILETYSKYILRHDKRPVNVYTFCEDHNFSESEFYSLYAGFDQVEEDYLRYFFSQTLALIAAEENVLLPTAKNRLLSFYYTFIGQLTLNRSLILFLLDTGQRSSVSLKRIWALKPDFTAFVKTLAIDESMEDIGGESERIRKLKDKRLTEAVWVNFLSVIKFWVNDTSPNFERTDIFIEKSVDTGFEFLDVKPLKKLVDLGKFLFNETKKPF